VSGALLFICLIFTQKQKLKTGRSFFKIVYLNVEFAALAGFIKRFGSI